MQVNPTDQLGVRRVRVSGVWCGGVGGVVVWWCGQSCLEVCAPQRVFDRRVLRCGGRWLLVGGHFWSGGTTY
jgi:hypothetical protein